MGSLPLANIRILSLAEQYPGPYASLLLADLGADVILIERPGGGDPSRRFPGLFDSLNRNKRSVVLDLKSDSGHEKFLELLDTADVVMEGFRPGVMARLKLGAEVLLARKPSLVYVSISSFGQTGPRAAVAGHDLSIQAAAGLIDVKPGQEEAAVLPTLPLADISSAMFAALGVVTALVSRLHSGKGAVIDVSMLDSLVSWMTPFLLPALNGQSVRPLPPTDPGYGLFATADGRQIALSITGEDHMWSALCRLLRLDGFADLAEQKRAERAEEIEPHLRRAVASRSYDTLYEQFNSAGIAFGPVTKLDRVLDDEQIIARRLLVEVQGQSRRLSCIRQPLLFDGQAGEIRWPAPRLGEHTEQILNELSTQTLQRAASL